MPGHHWGTAGYVARQQMPKSSRKGLGFDTTMKASEDSDEKIRLHLFLSVTRGVLCVMESSQTDKVSLSHNRPMSKNSTWKAKGKTVSPSGLCSVVAKLQGLESEWPVPLKGSEAMAICLVFLSLAVPTCKRQTLTPNPQLPYVEVM